MSLLFKGLFQSCLLRFLLIFCKLEAIGEDIRIVFTHVLFHKIVGVCKSSLLLKCRLSSWPPFPEVMV